MTWRHTNAFSNGDCREWLPDISPYREACNCTTPTPDPTSPCGFTNDYMRQRAYLPCGLPDGGLSHTHDDIFGPHRESAGCHTHVPTRCTCGHPIEEATR